MHTKSHSHHFLLLVICPQLAMPENGTISCSLGDDGVLSYKDTCSYTCNTGYELIGSDQRMCLFDGTWSVDDMVLCRESGRLHYMFYCQINVSYSSVNRQF